MFLWQDSACIECERNAHEVKLVSIAEEFNLLKEQLKEVFTPAVVVEELKRLEVHLNKVAHTKEKIKKKKIRRDFNPELNASNVDETVETNFDFSNVFHSPTN